MAFQPGLDGESNHQLLFDRCAIDSLVSLAAGLQNTAVEIARESFCSVDAEAQ